MALDQFWGVKPPETVSVAWGARIITNRNGKFDLLLDRQSMVGTEAEKKHLSLLLNDFQGLQRIEENYRAALAGGLVAGNAVLLEHPVLRCEARLSPALDYLYLSVWPTVNLTEFTLVNKPPEDLQDGEVIWSCDTLPKCGQVVGVPSSAAWAVVNGDCRMTVLGYGVEHRHLFCWGVLLSPSEQKRQQDTRAWEEGRWAYPGTFNIMGREWTPIEVQS